VITLTISINIGNLRIFLNSLFRKTDYKKLEVHHGYIQWLFPNYYGSSFNKDAFKLTSEEAKIFRENKEVLIVKLF